MRIFLTLAAFLLLGGPALALPAIDLPPFQGHHANDVIGMKSVTGSCGKAVVQIEGIAGVDDGYFTISDNARIIVQRDPRRKLVLTVQSGVLNDHNGLACVSTKAGTRLLVWSTCAGRTCPRDYSFFLIDPNRLVFIAPKDPHKETCDADCASPLLDDDLVERLNAQNQIED